MMSDKYFAGLTGIHYANSSRATERDKYPAESTGTNYANGSRSTERDKYFAGLTGTHYANSSHATERDWNGYDGPRRVLEQMKKLALAGSDSDAVANVAHGVANAGMSDSVKNIHPKFAGSHSTVADQFAYMDGNIPTHSDVWYLHVGYTILPVMTYGYDGKMCVDEDATSLVSKLISNFTKACNGVCLLRSPMNPSEISSNANNGREVVKEARYECPQVGGGFLWPSRGPRSVSAKGMNQSGSSAYCAYIAFPVGQVVPVIKSMSICVEEITQDMTDAGWSDSCSVSDGGGFFPPKPTGSLRGLKLLDYHGGFFHHNTEYPAADFSGLARYLKHQWLRYYFKNTDKFPVPGKFIGLLVEPESSHPWWFQDSSPFLYSGAFFETRIYTSGVVERVLADSDKKHNEVGKVYVVNIRGVLVHLQGTDFYEYEAGEEVCILKKTGVGSNMTYSWLDSDNLAEILKSLGDDPASGVYTLFDLYAIAPISFYLEGDS